MRRKFTDSHKMTAVAKTHKATDSNGNPKSRPIVGAARGLTTPLGELLSDILEPVAKARPRQWEAQSTEEVLRNIRDTNQVLLQRQVSELMVGSMDVKSLYPSIDQRIGPELVAKEIMESSIEFESVNYIDPYELHKFLLYMARGLRKRTKMALGLRKDQRDL